MSWQMGEKVMTDSGCRLLTSFFLGFALALCLGATDATADHHDPQGKATRAVEEMDRVLDQGRQAQAKAATLLSKHPESGVDNEVRKLEELLGAASKIQVEVQALTKNPDLKISDLERIRDDYDSVAREWSATSNRFCISYKKWAETAKNLTYKGGDEFCDGIHMIQIGVLVGL